MHTVEARRGLVEALVSLGQELRDREDLGQELLRYYRPIDQ